jgi:ElaB/YqjD/DUF883 family membrane-anchored ribosome-binding protein
MTFDGVSDQELVDRMKKVVDELQQVLNRLGIDAVKAANLRSEAEKIREELLSRGPTES